MENDCLNLKNRPQITAKMSDPNINHWMRFQPVSNLTRDRYVGLCSNLWGTTSPILIGASIIDFTDDPN
jgi:hypothetical protein